MFTSNLAPSTILLACDLGKSAGKFFYKFLNGRTQALWMDAEVAFRSASVTSQLNSGGRAQDNAWYRIGDQLTFIGKAAKAHIDYNSFKEDKCLKAAERIVGALSAIAFTHGLPIHFNAVIWILLPVNELATRKDIATRLTELCQGFRFRDEQEYQVNLQLSFRPEGYGIYVNRKQELQQTGIAIATRTTWIEMLGHRNGTQLAFETGTLNQALSSSKFPGFWEPFEKAAIAAGVSTVDFDVLLRALETGNPQQYSIAKSKAFDFSDAMHQIESGYLAALDPYFNDNLIPSLATGQGDALFSGGAAELMRSALTKYFDDKGFGNCLLFAGDTHTHLKQLIEEQLPEAQQMNSITGRMADCFGLFQALLGDVNRQEAA
jgi:hypothetical protein